MEAIIKRQADVIDGLINDNKKLQTEVERLKKELSDRKLESAPTATAADAVKKLKYTAPKGSMMGRLLSREALDDELVDPSDAARIKQLLKKGYSFSG